MVGGWHENASDPYYSSRIFVATDDPKTRADDPETREEASAPCIVRIVLDDLLESSRTPPGTGRSPSVSVRRDAPSCAEATNDPTLTASADPATRLFEARPEAGTFS
jgi:hypothetical protein